MKFNWIFEMFFTKRKCKILFCLKKIRALSFQAIGLGNDHTTHVFIILILFLGKKSKTHFGGTPRIELRWSELVYQWLYRLLYGHWQRDDEFLFFLFYFLFHEFLFVWELWGWCRPLLMSWLLVSFYCKNVILFEVFKDF